MTERVSRERWFPAPGRYLVGNPYSRFAVMRYRHPRFSRPKGGIIAFGIGLWWSL